MLISFKLLVTFYFLIVSSSKHLLIKNLIWWWYFSESEINDKNIKVTLYTWKLNENIAKSKIMD